jgi:hypothetical protein
MLSKDLVGRLYETRSENVVMLNPALIPQRPKTRKHLSFDPLICQIHERAEQLIDGRSREGTYSVADAVMSAMAMFSLKDPSLLAFEERRNDENMKNLFHIQQVPSDTQMRELLDPLQPDSIRPMFNDVFRELRRGKALESFVFLEDSYLLSLDGTGYFSSKKIHCDACLEKKNKKTGEITYQHQMLGAALVHPDLKQVVPLAPEPIIKQDGDNKNDCERNAAKRLLHKIREEHPHLRLIVVEDGLASNAPHIRLLKQLRMNFLLGVKPDDHEHLFDAVIQAGDEERFTTMSWTHPKDPQVLCEIGFVHDLPLNKSNPDLRVNFLQYIEFGPDGREQKKFSWVTDLTITRENAQHLVRGGRSRWKIENETFNTLKNQGYHFEHNYGHGQQNLSVVFAMLMMLAFLVDQTQELCCPLFQSVHKKLGSRRAVWDHVRSHFRHFRFQSMQHLYDVVLNGLAKELPAPTYASRRARVP